MATDLKGVAAIQTALLDASHVQPVVAVVWASWCGPCKLLKPKLEALSSKHNFPLVRIDGGTEREVAAELKVRSVPTVIAYRNGAEILRFAGDKPEGDLKVALMKAGIFQQPLI